MGELLVEDRDQANHLWGGGNKEKKSQPAETLSAGSGKTRKNFPGRSRKEVFQQKQHEVFLVLLLLEGTKFRTQV